MKVIITDKFEKASDKFCFFCFYIILLNHKLRKGWISKATWCEDLILITQLYINGEDANSIIDIGDDVKRDKTHVNALKELFDICKC